MKYNDANKATSTVNMQTTNITSKLKQDNIWTHVHGQP